MTMNFDLLLKNFNLGQNFLTRRDVAFILHMCITCDKAFHMVPTGARRQTIFLSF